MRKKVCENYQITTQNHEVSRCFWENGNYRLARHRITTDLQSVKNTVVTKGSEVGCVNRGMPAVSRSSCGDQGPGHTPSWGNKGVATGNSMDEKVLGELPG